MHRHITGFSNPAVKHWRSLREKKLRKRAREFLVEGLRLLEDARVSGRLPRTLIRAEGREHPPLLARLEAEVIAGGGEIVTTTPEILAKITGKSNAQSVVGVFDEWDTRLAAIERDTAAIWLVAQELRDPGNLGTMLRTGDAVGAGGLILIDDCADPFSAEAVRASMGALFTQGLARARWDEFVPWLRQGGGGGGGRGGGGRGQLVAASLRAVVPYREAAYEAPCFILVGNESQGLPEAYEAECDLRVTMPMRGRADSLNAAVAGAVLAYEVLARLEA